MKKCSKCQRVLIVAEFPLTKQGRYHSPCFDCRKAQKEKTRNKNIKWMNEYGVRKRRAKGITGSHHGEKHSQAKLTEQDVREIFWSYYAERFSAQYLSQKFGVSPDQIYKIIARKSWGHLDIDDLLKKAKEHIK